MANQVKPLKDNAAEGYEEELDVVNDQLVVGEVQFQESSTIDGSVRIFRVSGELFFQDNATGKGVSLTDLLTDTVGLTHGQVMTRIALRF